MNIEPRLDKLIHDIPVPCRVFGEVRGVVITGIALDSRTGESQAKFLSALPEAIRNGHRYIPNAIAQGAVAIMGTQSMEGLSVPYLQMEEAGRRWPTSPLPFTGIPAGR